MEVKNLKMGVLGCILATFLLSCEREIVQPAQPTPEKENVVDSTETKEEESGNDKKEQNDQKAETIGTGSGKLTIIDVEGKNLVIKPGNYSEIMIKGVSNTSIRGNGEVKIRGGIINLINTNGLNFSGISIENSQKGIIIKESVNNLKLTDFNFKNISSTVIKVDIQKKYDGTPQSFSSNIHLDKINGENVRSLFQGNGGIRNDGFYGLIKGFKFTNSKVINSPHLESAVYLNCGEDFEISNNIINNVNIGDKKHNGIFHVRGNGKIFGNKITNHQGNAVRSWLFSITKPNSVVEIHDNIVYNSEMYSAFEVQVTPAIKQSNSFVPANAKVYNNTVGRMNSGPEYYEGRVIDIYQTYGSVDVYNNLYFDMRDNLVSLNQSHGKYTDVTEKNNQYFDKATDAVYNLINFKSKVPNIGASIK